MDNLHLPWRERTITVDFPLYRRLPPATEASSDAILNAFLGYVEEKNLVPYNTQEESILELLEEKNVILNTPTGSGKSLVATFLHFQALARGRRSVGAAAPSHERDASRRCHGRGTRSHSDRNLIP